jgi:hypothetical protein
MKTKRCVRKTNIIVEQLDADFVKRSLLDGTTFDEVRQIIVAAQTFCGTREVCWLRFHSTTFAHCCVFFQVALEYKVIQVPQRKDSIYNAINKEFAESKDCSVIIGIDFTGGGGHWTTVIDASENVLECYDGAMPRQLKQAYYGDTWCKRVDSEQIFVLYVK